MGWPGPLTHRQFEAWQAWLDLDMDRPSRTDWYLMQLAAMLAGGIGTVQLKKGRSVDPGKLKLSFGGAAPKPPTEPDPDEHPDAGPPIRSAEENARLLAEAEREIERARIERSKRSREQQPPR